jgi:glutaminyl-peptide cyclotransferase
MRVKCLNPFCQITIIVCEKNMHKFNSSFILFFISFFSPSFAFSKPFSFENNEYISKKNIETYLKDFVREPHPFGSPANEKLAQDLRESLAKFGLSASLQNFKSPSPDTDSLSSGEMKLKTRSGNNVVAKREGVSNCAVLFGGHYDTKNIPGESFVGANDGGSSTALLLELARAAKITQFNPNSLGSCSLYFVLFDGEESVLPQWNDGQKLFFIQDNLYGSRSFVQKNLRREKNFISLEGHPLSMAFIFDMIGHKNQTLSITQGSNGALADQFVQSNQKTKIQKSDIFMEDDHVPFLKFKVPLLHIIDWKNLDEWHTPHDDLNIISYEAIMQLGENTLEFLKQTKLSGHSH